MDEVKIWVLGQNIYEYHWHQVYTMQKCIWKVSQARLPKTVYMSLHSTTCTLRKACAPASTARYKDESDGNILHRKRRIRPKNTTNQIPQKMHSHDQSSSVKRTVLANFCG